MVKQRYTEAINTLFKMARFNGKANEITHEGIKKEIELITNDQNEILKLNESTMLVSRSSLNLNSSYLKLAKISKIDNSKLEGLDLKTEEPKVDTKPTIFNYLNNPKRNLLSTITLSYVWMSIAMIYFGMTIGNYIFSIETGSNEKFNMKNNL